MLELQVTCFELSNEAKLHLLLKMDMAEGPKLGHWAILVNDCAVGSAKRASLEIKHPISKESLFPISPKQVARTAPHPQVLLHVASSV